MTNELNEVVASAVEVVEQSSSALETMDQALSSLIGSVVTAAESTGDFVVEQVPLVLKQILLWHGTISFIAFAGGIILVYLAWLAFKKSDKWYETEKTKHDAETDRLKAIVDNPVEGERIVYSDQREYDKRKDFDKDGGYAALCIIPHIIVALIGLSVTLSHWTWLKIVLAPKLYLLEYAADLLK
jgi:hypothetical protein